jgi:chaperone protein EcpD
VLEARNDSSYHVSLSGVHLDSDGGGSDGGDGMIEPHGVHRFALKGLHAQPGHPRVAYVAIDDYGASREHEAVAAP